MEDPRPFPSAEEIAAEEEKNAKRIDFHEDLLPTPSKHLSVSGVRSSINSDWWKKACDVRRSSARRLGIPGVTHDDPSSCAASGVITLI
jgi:hypothetical protein